MTKNIIIAVLIIALSIFGYKLYQKSSDTGINANSFWKHEGDVNYELWSSAFRAEGHKKVGVWYDSATIRYYLDKIYPKLVKNMDGINDADYKWGVGFYFTRVLDSDGDKRINFCVIPTLMKKDSTILDFFDPNNCKYYNRCKPNISSKSGNGDTTGYNAGHLWP